MTTKVDIYRSLGLHQLEALHRYLAHGLRPGSAYCALLSNDLMGVMRSADPETIATLGTLARYLYNMVPSVACGSREAVEGWLAMTPEQRDYVLGHSEHIHYIEQRRKAETSVGRLAAAENESDNQ